MIREEKVKVFTGMDEIYVSTLNITLGVGKGYNSCSFVGTNLNILKNDNIKVIINADSYFFKVFKIDNGEFGEVTVSANGFPYDLENQPTSDDILSYVDSNDLIDGERGSIEVVNNLPNIDFKTQSYATTATPLQRITDMVSVVGGEKYEYNSKLYLEELKSISQTPIISHSFLDNEITSFAYSDNTEEERLINKIIINPSFDDIFSETKITVNFNDKTGKGLVYFNPSLSQGYSFEASLINIQTNTLLTVEEIIVNNDFFITAKSGIDEIISITLNGEDISNYDFVVGYNSVKFNETKTGSIKITYKTKGGFFTISQSTKFDIIYGNQIVDGFLEMNNTVASISGNFVNIENPLYYDATSSTLITYSYFGDLTLVFKSNTGNITTTYRQEAGLTVKYISDGTWNDMPLLDGITIDKSTAKSNTATETIVFNDDLQKYVVYISGYIDTIREMVLNDGTSIGYTLLVRDAFGSYLEYDAQYDGKEVNISYTAIVSQAHIPVPSNTTVSELFALSQIVNNIASTSGEYGNSNNGSNNTYCSIPSDVEIDMAEQLNTSTEKTIGKTVFGNNGLGSFTVDNFGKIIVPITSKNRFTIDCDSIITNAKIYIDSTKVL